jgi:hypothetical protein
MSYYPDAFWSKYHDWFVELGYPQLDIQVYEDGEWSIIETMNAPIMPSLSKFKVILRGMKNVIISRGFVEKYIKQIDPQRKEFWERERLATKAAEDAVEIREKHSEEFAAKASEAVLGNDALMERIAEKGIEEMDLTKIRENIPNNKL